MIGFLALIVAAVLAITVIVIGIVVLSGGPRERHISMRSSEDEEE